MSRRVTIALSTLFALGLLGIVYAVALSGARDTLLTRARATAAFSAEVVRAEIDRRRHIPAVLASDPVTVAVALGGHPDLLNRRLEMLAITAEAEAIYVLDTEGTTIAASNWRSPDSYVGENYAFRAYFQTAREGGIGREFAIGTTTGRPGLFVSHPIRGGTGVVVGIAVIKVATAAFDRLWQGIDGEALLLDEDGIVIGSSHPAWLYRGTHVLDETRREAIARDRFAGETLRAMAFHSDGEARITIGEETFLRALEPVPAIAGELWLLVPESRAHARAWPPVATAAVAILLLLLLAALARSRRILSALTASRQESSELARLNAALESEVAVRRRTEADLVAAQTKLRMSERLAALGQLSASVAHEIGQPLFAMRTNLSTARREAELGRLATSRLERLTRLVERLSGIAEDLRFFSRKDERAVGRVDLREVLSGAMETMEPSLRAASARLRRDLPAAPIFVKGDPRRLEQVVVNLMKNALEAMHESVSPLVTVIVDVSEGMARLTVRDRGHGLANGEAQMIFEPFVTRHSHREGLGLGLAISAGIMQEHGGTLTASNNRGGGAAFVMALPIDGDVHDQRRNQTADDPDRR